MNFIKKIFEDKVDDLVHNQFTRFGKGEYERAFVKLKKSKKLSVKTSFEFSNDLVYLIADNAEGDIEISGVIIRKGKDLDLDLENEKGKRGKIYKLTIKKQNISKTKLKEIYNEFKGDSLLLTLKAKNCSLKCKNSLPKPGGKLKENFCISSFSNLDVAREFAFDVSNFKNLEIVHTFKIEDIIAGNEKDFEEIRKNSKRKGKVIRSLDVDGEHIEKEHDLLV